MQQPQTPTIAARDAEQKGRKYQKVRYGLHSRKVDGDGTWYGSSNYKSEQDARKALLAVGKPICGGLVGFSGPREMFEFRITREVTQCEVVDVAHVSM